MRSLLTILAVLALPLLVIDVAHAQVIDLSPEVVAKIKGLADAARFKHPTSPTEAASAFGTAFNGEFGDVTPYESRLEDSKDLLVQILTPLVLYAAGVRTSIEKFEPVRDPVRTEAIFGGDPVVTINVTPRTMTAPNIERMLVFRDDKPVPMSSALAPRTFQNRLGGSVTLGQGFVAVPVSAFLPGGTVKIVAIATPKNFEWTIDSETLKKFK
jgi:hypothetical protein